MLDQTNKPNDGNMPSIMKAFQEDRQHETGIRAVTAIIVNITKVLGRLLTLVFVLWWVLPHIDMWVSLLATGHVR